MREITYAQAVAEATVMAMKANPDVFVLGEGVDDTAGIFGTTKPVHDMFGDARVFDAPLSEQAVTGMAIGAAIMGMRPIYVHARTDFLLLTLDQLANHAAKWSYMSGGQLQAPIVVRAIVGRGWGQGAQHSQSLQAAVAMFPGMHVLMPATPKDAKGMLLSALIGQAPTVLIEHRWLHNKKGHVPEGLYTVPIGQADVARKGKDVTIVSVSLMLHEALAAAERLLLQGIEAEVIDLRSVRPWDADTICTSVAKTGRLIVADTSWVDFGISAEIAATVGERVFGKLRAPIRRIGLPAVPTPCCSTLEVAYYPSADAIFNSVQNLLTGDANKNASQTVDPDFKPFSGHF